AARAVGAAPTLRPRMPHVFATPARGLASAITEVESEIEIRPATSTRDGGEAPSRAATPSAHGDSGEPADPELGALPIDIVRTVGRADGRRAGSMIGKADGEPLVQPPLAAARPAEDPRGGTRGGSEARARAARARPLSRPAAAVGQREGRTAAAPAADE